MEEEEKMREEELKEMSDKMRERWLQTNQSKKFWSFTVVHLNKSRVNSTGWEKDGEQREKKVATRTTAPSLGFGGRTRRGRGREGGVGAETGRGGAGREVGRGKGRGGKRRAGEAGGGAGRGRGTEKQMRDYRGLVCDWWITERDPESDIDAKAKTSDIKLQLLPALFCRANYCHMKLWLVLLTFFSGQLSSSQLCFSEFLDFTMEASSGGSGKCLKQLWYLGAYQPVISS